MLIITGGISFLWSQIYVLVIRIVPLFPFIFIVKIYPLFKHLLHLFRLWVKFRASFTTEPLSMNEVANNFYKALWTAFKLAFDAVRTLVLFEAELTAEWLEQ